MYLAIQGLVTFGPFGAADRVQQHHAVVGEQLGAVAEEGVVVADADMLEHADRDDAVEVSPARRDSPAGGTRRAPARLFSAGALVGDRKLLARQRDAGDVARRQNSAR